MIINMLNKEKYLLVTFFFTVLVLLAFSPCREAYADHIHTDACYDGAKHYHTGTSGSCYATRTKTTYCNGEMELYNYYLYYDGLVNEYWYICKNCQSLLTQARFVIRKANYYTENYSTGKYTERANNSYSTTLQAYVSKQSAVDDVNATWGGCPGCGLYMTTDRMKEILYLEDVYESIGWEQFRCSKCKNVVSNNHFCEELCYDGMAHGYRNIVENVLVCTKEEGAYYDLNGVKCTPICDKTVETMTPLEPSQEISDENEMNLLCSLRLLNGEERTVLCLYDAFDNGRLNIPQTVILKPPLEYRYSLVEGKTVKISAETQIEVTLKGLFDVDVERSDGGTTEVVGTDEDSKAKASDNITVIAAPCPGYQFNFLKVSGALEETFYEPEITFKMPQGNIKITVSFSPCTYRLSFDVGEGSFTDLFSTKPYIKVLYMEKLSSYSVFPAIPVRSGHIFGGWYTRPSGEGERIYPYSRYEITTDSVLYAYWIKVEEFVRIYEFDDLYGELPEPLDMEGYIPSTEGFWRMEAKDGQDTETIISPYSVVDSEGPVYLYGCWEPKSYTVTFDYNYPDDTEYSEYKEVLYHSRIETMPVPVFEGYTFEGWFTERESGIRRNESDVFSFTESIILYAHWADKASVSLTVDPFLLNNTKNIDITPEKEVLITKGDKLTLKITVNGAAEGDRLTIIPGYFSYPEFFEEKQAVHMFCTTVHNGGIHFFAERGRDIPEECTIDLNGPSSEIFYDYVLPFYSYPVSEEDMEWFVDYSSINTLSGKEDFFDHNRIVETDLEIVLWDAEGNEKLKTTSVLLAQMK